MFKVMIDLYVFKNYIIKYDIDRLIIKLIINN